MGDLADAIEQVWEIACSRCANTATAYPLTLREAAAEFAAAGWTRDRRTYCPDCNQETR